MTGQTARHEILGVLQAELWDVMGGNVNGRDMLVAIHPNGRRRLVIEFNRQGAVVEALSVFPKPFNKGTNLALVPNPKRKNVIEFVRPL